ncbi:rRNA maturation RNase YbeY [Spongiivirga citrea]|uniref:Endoribonuclease YbeY n=1 Tax=Spongiivirga citrea TaxID=1481457 RepID=A0A6M0CHQ3_9FLAO|nr:rRNA maturation RNase YbeY [Spongiivirga citrea]NER17401.1 rRNA maturation RNase YbeY [Spongiivirga citrea]
MITFNYETDFEVENEEQISNWIGEVLLSEEKSEGEISYIFCDDEYLHNINLQYLNHDTLTDIISFDYGVGNQINGDIFISVERVQENAKQYEVSFEDELKRVIIHGILHYCGYKDKTEADQAEMTQKENEKIAMFHVEH